uniref:Xyloglucan endotransglucosylase/hydrolase n=1 Tax=Anthurium amnicola TaxID=1678845 RepID=A0A1D1Y0H0_9ARAE
MLSEEEMGSPWCKLLLLLVLFSCLGITWQSHGLDPPTAVSRLTGLFPHLTFDEGYVDFFGGSNIQKLKNGTYVNISLNKISGSGFVSRDKYYYGFFSAAIKLPPSYSAGVVVAFYMSNADVFPHTHDEIDFELLGHEKRKEWVLQTNVYGNGSVGTGREEKFYLWFDPAEQFHEYSILWNYHHIVFLVDNIPVREVNHSDAMRAYPSKPMSAFATIWDGSQWATHGGKKPVNYAYGPFMASLSGLEMEGCVWNRSSSAPPCPKGGPSERLGLDPVEGPDFAKLLESQRTGMEWVRGRLMFYSYCSDHARYSVLPSECGSG